MSLKPEHREILDILTKELERSPDLRFGQLLFNLHITEFADPNYPVSGKSGLRDIYNDRDKDILDRVRKSIKKFEEQF